MIVAVIAMLIGCLMIIGNPGVAVITGTAQKGYFSDFSTSVARQTITIIGVVLIVVGFTGFIFL